MTPGVDRRMLYACFKALGLLEGNLKKSYNFAQASCHVFSPDIFLPVDDHSDSMQGNLGIQRG